MVQDAGRKIHTPRLQYTGSWWSNSCGIACQSEYKSIENCYSDSNCYNTYNNTAACALCDYDVKNSFFNINNYVAQDSKGVGLSTEEMKNRQIYVDAGWDFDTVWEMDPTTGYPRLQWEKNIKP